MSNNLFFLKALFTVMFSFLVGSIQTMAIPWSPGNRQEMNKIHHYFIAGNDLFTGSFNYTFRAYSFGGINPCENPVTDINVDVPGDCVAYVINGGGLAQSFIPSNPQSVGAGIQFQSFTFGQEVTLSLWDGLPNAGGNMLVTGTTQTNGTVWADVYWDSVADVTVGNTYYIVIDGDSALPCISGSSSDLYPDGMLFSNFEPFPDYDFSFRIFSCDDEGGETGDPCENPELDINVDVPGDCMAFVTYGGLAQSFIPLNPQLAGAGIQFQSFTFGQEVTLSLWDGLPNENGNILAAGSTQTNGTVWADVYWDSVVDVTVGNTYYIVIEGDSELPCISGGFFNPYPDGILYSNNFEPFQSYDFSFRIFSCDDGGEEEPGDPCENPELDINVDVPGDCVAYVINGGGLAQSFIPLNPQLAGSGIQFQSFTFGQEVTLSLWDGLPNAGGNMLVTGTTQTNGTVWADVYWNSVADVTVGNTYYIVIEGDSALPCISGSSFNPYTDGMLFSNFEPFPDYDFSFRIFSCEDEGGETGNPCENPELEIDQNINDIGMAYMSQNGLAQSFKPLYPESAGVGIMFQSFSFGLDVTLSLWDGLPNAGGNMLASGTTQTNGNLWADVYWNSIVNVTAGNTYYIMIEGDSSLPMVVGSVYNPYPDGMLFSNFEAFPDYDFTFRTFTCNPVIVDESCENPELELNIDFPGNCFAYMFQDGLAQSFMSSHSESAGVGIQFEHNSYDLDVTLSLWDGLPNAGGNMLAAKTKKTNGTWVDVFWDSVVSLTIGETYYIVIEGDISLPCISGFFDPYPDGMMFADNFEPYPGFDFSFRTYSCDDEGWESDPCEDKITVACGVTYTANLIPNTGAWINYPDVTDNYTGSEQVFEFTAQQTGTYTIELDQGENNADFFIMDACGNTANNLTGGYWTGLSNETIDLTEGVTYFIIADLHELAGGATTVSVKINCLENSEPGNCPIEYEGSLSQGLGGLSDGVALAADFPIGPGQQWHVETVRIQIINTVTSVDVSFYSDISGHPGIHLIEPFTVIPVSQIQIGTTNEGFPIYELELDLSANDVLLDGEASGSNIWMGIKTNGFNNFWAFAETIHNNTNFYVSYDNYLNWTDVGTMGIFQDGAFSVCITPNPCNEKIFISCDTAYSAELVPDSGEWTNYTNGSFEYTGSEQVFEFTAPLTGTYEFELDQGENDADFFLMETCSNMANNLIGGYWDGAENQTIDLIEGTAYYLIADLKSLAEGATTVSVKINCPDPAPGDCPVQYAGTLEDGLGDLSSGDVVLASDFPVGAGEHWDVDILKIQMINTVNTVRVAFYADNGNKPGNPVFTPTHVVPVSQTFIGVTPVGGNNVYEIELDLSDYGISLDGGESGANYWVGVSTTSSFANHWIYTPEVNNGTNFFASFDNFANWEDAGNSGFFKDGAFSICLGEPDMNHCEQDFYVDNEPNRIANISEMPNGKNWVANDILIPGDTQFKIQSIIFELAVIHPDATPATTYFDLEIFNDNGAGGVGNTTGITYHFDGSNATYSPNGLLWDTFPQFTIALDLPDLILQANGNADTRYWLALNNPGLAEWWVYWVAYPFDFTPDPDSKPMWAKFSTMDNWAPVLTEDGYHEGFMKVNGQCETLLGTDDLISFDFVYYPNPVRDVLNITSEKQIRSVTIYNLTGQKVSNINSAEIFNGKVDVTSLSAGVYVFRTVLEGGQIETFKIIKK